MEGSKLIWSGDIMLNHTCLSTEETGVAILAVWFSPVTIVLVCDDDDDYDMGDDDDDDDDVDFHDKV